MLVLSGAGTGKTKVITERTAHILRTGLAQPWQILALTFTNRAANEMRERVRCADCESATELWLGTFHSICLRILRANTERAGLRRDFLVYGEDDQRQVLKTALANIGLNHKSYPLGELIEKIQARKDKGLSESQPPDKIYDAYNTELARLDAVDFGDLILKVLELFIAVPDVLQKYQRQFKYIMVDEYQDTNASQHQLLRLLSTNGNICCVGDDDQSIYSWRGADIKNILNFEKEYPGATIIRLETNYRSTPAILGAANSLIKKNHGRLGKDLRAAPGAASGEKVSVLCLPTEFDEARLFAEAVGSWTEPAVAVLIRAGSLSRVFEEEFARRGIPYKLVGATKFYDRAEIRDAIAYARLLQYPFDDISFMRIISKPRRGFGEAALNKIHDFAKKNQCNMMDALGKIPLSGKQRAATDEFLKAFNFDWQTIDPKKALFSLLENSGYMKMWRESKDPDAEDRLQNINELLTNVIAKYSTIAEFLEHAALMMTEDDGVATSSRDVVSIMTMHAAKGLEFNTVFMPAWEEGIFPNEKSINDGGLEEERRLAYVAITRARRRAIISCAASRMVFGMRQNNPPSRFIGEIDEEFIEGWKSRPENRKPVAGRRFAIHGASTKDRITGKLVSHADLGSGVVIEEDKSNDILTVAFGDKGIKKVKREFLQFI